MKLAALSFAACAACRSAPEAPTPVSAPVPVTHEQAEALVRAAILRESPEINPQFEFVLNAIPQPEAWQTLGVQLFQVGADSLVQAFETFAVRKGKVQRLGTGFGGMGVGSTLVADVDGDRSPDLAFAFSWGSGRHRSQVGLLRIAGDRMSTLPCEWSAAGDIFLVPGGSQGVAVFGPNGRVGRLEVREGALRVVVD